jgi:hypothetical protein
MTAGPGFVPVVDFWTPAERLVAGEWRLSQNLRPPSNPSAQPVS